MTQVLCQTPQGGPASNADAAESPAVYFEVWQRGSGRGEGRGGAVRTGTRLMEDRRGTAG